MKQKLQLLTFSDVVYHRSISRQCLFKQTVAQFQRQQLYLNTLRIRRPDVTNMFSEVIDNAMTSNVDISNWANKSKIVMTNTFEKIISDGSSWNGHGVGAKSLIKPLNDICRNSLHAMLCLDLLSHDACSKGFFRREIALRGFIERIIEDVSSFSKEKFGVAPEINVEGDISINIFAPLIEYVTVEIVKNAIKAVVDRYGALNIDDAPPITINIGIPKEELIRVSFHDYGIGMEEEVVTRCFDAFFSKTAEREAAIQPSYQYSRDFGSKFSGVGIGLLKSKVYCDFHEASILVKSKCGEGTTFSIVFKC